MRRALSIEDAARPSMRLKTRARCAWLPSPIVIVAHVAGCVVCAIVVRPGLVTIEDAARPALRSQSVKTARRPALKMGATP